MAAQRLHHEARRQQPPRQIVDHHLPGIGNDQQPRSQVAAAAPPRSAPAGRPSLTRSPTTTEPVAMLARAHAVRPACPPVPGRRARRVRIVLVRPGPAEVREHAVTEEVRHIAVELGHHVRAGLLEGLGGLAGILGVRFAGISAAVHRHRIQHSKLPGVRFRPCGRCLRCTASDQTAPALLSAAIASRSLLAGAPPTFTPISIRSASVRLASVCS